MPIHPSLLAYRDQHRTFHALCYSESEAEVTRVYCGSGLDLGLSEGGKAAIQKFSTRFKKNPLKVKRIVASSELRAVQAADFMHDVIKTKINLWSSLRDQSLGTLEGTAYLAGTPALGIQDAPPEGETKAQFLNRISAALGILFQEGIPSVVVTHPRVMSAIFEVLGLEKEGFQPLEWYTFDLPAGQGNCHWRKA
jgi:broad specificity phosphatase PhoE